MFEALEPRLLLDGGTPDLLPPGYIPGSDGGSAYVAPQTAGTNAAAAQADLTGQLGRVILPEAVVAGQRLRGVVQVQVLNVGNTATGLAARANISILARNTATGEEVLLRQVNNCNVARLAPDGARVRNFYIRVNRPAGLPTGEYEIQALIEPARGVGETNLANNQVVANAAGQTARITSADPFVDLTPTITKVVTGAPAQPGKLLVAASQVLNQGNVLYRGRVNLTLQAVGNGQTFELRRMENLWLILGAGRTKTYVLRVKMPDDLPCGDYDVRLIVEPVGDVVEGGGLGDSNNTADSAAAFTFDNPYKKEWIQQLTTSAYGEGRSVAVDPWNNVYLASLETKGPNNIATAYLRKYNSAGKLLWTRIQPHLDNVEGSLVPLAVDAAGNVFLGGTTVSSDNTSNALVNKYNPAGRLLWTRRLETPAYDGCCSLATDSAGNVYMVGLTGGNLFSETLGGSDAFIAKYDAAGNFIWGRQYGGDQYEVGSSVAADEQSNIFLAGTATTIEGQTEQRDVFLVKYDSNGQLIWSRQKDIHKYDVCGSVAVDAAGNAYLAGGTRNIDYDAFLSKYDAAGNNLWTELLSSNGHESARALAVDADGNSYMTGYTRGVLGAMNAGEADLFLHKRDTDGNLLWTRQLGTTADDYGQGVALDAKGFVYVCGMTGGVLGAAGSGQDNPFLAKLSGDMSLDPGLSVSVGIPVGGKPVAATGTARIDFLNDGYGIGVGRVDFELWATTDGVIDGSAGDFLLRSFWDEIFVHAPDVTRYFWADYELPEGVNPADVTLISQVNTGGGDNYYGGVVDNWGNYYGCTIRMIGGSGENNYYGDFNLDGNVDANDFNSLTNNYYGLMLVGSEG